MDIFLVLLIAAVASYLLGSVSFAVIVSKIVTKKDVRQMGSGNAGMTNVMRTVGVVPGAITFLLDLGKAAGACLIGRYILFDYLFAQTGSILFFPIYGAYFCGILCQLGHIYPVFFGFKGGKAVAVSAGVMLACNWRAFIIGILIFVAVFIFTRTVSIGSLCTVIVVPFAILLFGTSPYRWVEFLLCALVAAVVIIMHRSNIERIKKGEEKPLTVKGERKNG